MAKKVPRLEALIVVVFLFSVALWSISKCSETRRERVRSLQTELEEKQQSEGPKYKRDTVYLPQPAVSGPSPAPLTITPAAPTAPPKRPVLLQEPPSAVPEAAAYSTLYVTIDGLNLRKEPNRRSPVLGRLKLYEAVLYLNKKSEQPEEINLGREKVVDYWVYVRTQSGKEGWVFGAGLHYYPTKRPGVD